MASAAKRRMSAADAVDARQVSFLKPFLVTDPRARISWTLAIGVEMVLVLLIFFGVPRRTVSGALRR